MKRFGKENRKKLLIVLAVSLVLAMAIGSFAMGEAQVQTTPQVSSNADSAFTVEGGTKDQDYHFETRTNPSSGSTYVVLHIHPQNVDTEITIKNTDPQETLDCIKVTSAAKITLAGVNINTVDNSEPGLEIEKNATFNVNITLAAGSENTLKASMDCAGLQKINDNTVINPGTLTIGGKGELTARSGTYSAGIGGAGGEGEFLKASNIKITGGNITAIGFLGGAGIGGGLGCDGNNIEITGGVVKAIGGYMEDTQDTQDSIRVGAGIGGGSALNESGEIIGGGASGNKISGNAVVFAVSGGTYSDGTKKEALQGFDEASQGSINDCIAFTGVGVYDSQPPFELKDVNWDDGQIYGNAIITQNLEIPSSLIIPNNRSFTIDQGGTLIVPAEMELKNEGTLTINGNVDLSKGGKITTLVNYDVQGGALTDYNEYKTYKDSSSSDVKTYGTLPGATKDGYYFGGWYTEKEGKGTKIEESSNVLLNVHVLYANWTTEPGPQPGPEPTPTPEPTPDPSVNPDGGSGSGSGSGASSKTGDPFMGGMALALLGVATTGAILSRKLR